METKGHDWQSMLEALTAFNRENYLFYKTFPALHEYEVSRDGKRRFNAFFSACAEIRLRFEHVRGIDWSVRDVDDLTYLIVKAYECYTQLLHPKPFVAAHFTKVEAVYKILQKMRLICG